MAKYLDKEGLVAYDAAIKKYNKVYIKAAETPEAGYAATYEIYQGVNDLGTPTGTASKINIPFSKVLKSGELREDTDKVYIDLFFDEDKTDKISVEDSASLGVIYINAINWNNTLTTETLKSLIEAKIAIIGDKNTYIGESQ